MPETIEISTKMIALLTAIIAFISAIVAFRKNREKAQSTLDAAKKRSAASPIWDAIEIFLFIGVFMFAPFLLMILMKWLISVYNSIKI